jgi:hypothetical protein
LLISLDSVLQSAGWKRGKPIQGFPSIMVFGKDNPYSVPVALTDGIRISVQSSIDLSTLRVIPERFLPVPAGAAKSLYVSLLSSLRPTEENPARINVEKGESKTVSISIGKKP